MDAINDWHLVNFLQLNHPSGDTSGQVHGGSRRDMVQAVINCCNSKLGVNISENDIQSGYRISKSGPLPIIVTFTSMMVTDIIYALRKT